jgi:hypothetical protein
MVARGEKLGGGNVDRSAGVLGIMMEVIFLGSSRVHPTLLGQHEILPRTRTAHRKRTCGIHGPVQEVYVSCVSGFPCRV